MRFWCGSKQREIQFCRIGVGKRIAHEDSVQLIYRSCKYHNITAKLVLDDFMHQCFKARLV